jgi:hypothetical protein
LLYLFDTYLTEGKCLSMSMRQFFDKDGPLSRKWNSPWLGVPFWCAGAALIPSPGKAIGALAVVAGLMSVREMKVSGRILWVLLLIAFLDIEFHAIDKDREENDAKQRAFFEAQKTGFETIASQAKADFKQTTQGLDASIRSLSQLLGTTQRVVENVTGGDSFAFIYPSGQNPLALNIHNDGKQILTGVTVKIWPVIGGDCGPGKPDCIADIRQSFHPIEVGTLSPEWGEILPNGILQPVLNSAGTATYKLLIHAQNGGTTELLYLRRSSKDSRGFAYRMTVWTTSPRKKGASDVWSGKNWWHIVKNTDWTDTN